MNRNFSSYLNIMLRLSTLSKLRMSRLRKIGRGSEVRLPDKVLIVLGANVLSQSAFIKTINSNLTLAVLTTLFKMYIIIISISLYLQSTYNNFILISERFVGTSFRSLTILLTYKREIDETILLIAFHKILHSKLLELQVLLNEFLTI